MAKLKKFNAFVDGLFPSEADYVRKYNLYADPDLKVILDLIWKRVNNPWSGVDFDPKIDPRKYSKLMAGINRKLKNRDVDAYFGWISELNHRITIDAITPQDQAMILREMKTFEIKWFHMESFYRLIENYEGYLIRRFRESDFIRVRDFLERHKKAMVLHLEVKSRINELTQSIAFDKGEKLNKREVNWLLKSFRDEDLSKKNRFHALLAFLMYHINRKDWEPLLVPLEEFERSLFEGEFYSRRILANVYANKLIVYSSKGDFQQAAIFGFHSIKHITEDHLYYLNNFVSVLLHLNRNKEALSLMQNALLKYKNTRDLSRKIVFTSNYCRTLNRLGQYTKSARLANRLINDLGTKILEFKWHYFFRNYFYALLKMGSTERILKLNRHWKLVEREKAENHSPHLRAMVLAAEYQEIKLSGEDFFEEFKMLSGKNNREDEDFSFLMDVIKEHLPTGA